MGNTHSRTTSADALVIFGATGDLARKMIFPALYAMVKRGILDVSVVGVASSKWESGATAQTGDGQPRASRQDR